MVRKSLKKSAQDEIDKVIKAIESLSPEAEEAIDDVMAMHGLLGYGASGIVDWLESAKDYAGYNANPSSIEFPYEIDVNAYPTDLRLEHIGAYPSGIHRYEYNYETDKGNKFEVVVEIKVIGKRGSGEYECESEERYVFSNGETFEPGQKMKCLLLVDDEDGSEFYNPIEILCLSDAIEIADDTDVEGSTRKSARRPKFFNSMVKSQRARNRKY